MTYALTQTAFTAAFACLGDKCEDTCCQNWSMQVDDAAMEKYAREAPGLLAAVETEPDGAHVMKRDPATRMCVKLEGGLCGIHREKGSDFLGDACHFYPRATRAIGNRIIMTATSSCPEILRLALSMESAFAQVGATVERLPFALKNYLPEGMGEEAASNVHQAFLACALDETLAPQHALARISSVARSLELLDKHTLDSAVSLYLRLADSRIPPAEKNPADAFNLLHALCGLIVASHKPISERLKKIVSDMERSLAATLDWNNVTIQLGEQSVAQLQEVAEVWKSPPAHYIHALRRMLALQLSLHYFPFAGLGNNASERITFIGARFAIMKLAIACAHLRQGELASSDIVRILQSLSRFLDHLGDANFFAGDF